MDDYSVDDSAEATPGVDWGSVLNTGLTMTNGLVARYTNQGTVQPTVTAGPIAQNPTPQPTFLAKLGMPIWAVVLSVVAVLGVIVWAFKR